MEFFILISLITFGYALESICYKYYEKINLSTTILAVTFWTLLGYLATSVFFVLIDFNLYTQNISFINIVFTAINSVFLLLQMILWVKMIRHLKMSIASPIINFQIIIISILSWLFFNDSLNKTEIVLIILMFVFCILLGFFEGKQKTKPESKDEKQKTAIDKNFFIGIMFAFLWMSTNITRSLLTKNLMISNLNPMAYQTIYYLFAFIFATVFFLIHNKKENNKNLNDSLQKVFKYKWFKVVLFATLLSGFAHNIIIKNYNIGLISAILSINSIIVIIYGRIVFKEKISKPTYFVLGGILITSALLSFVTS